MKTLLALFVLFPTMLFADISPPLINEAKSRGTTVTVRVQVTFVNVAEQVEMSEGQVVIEESLFCEEDDEGEIICQ
jgi:hypothetical protein